MSLCSSRILFSGLSAAEFPVFLGVCSAVEHCLITYCFPVTTVSLAYILRLQLIVLHSGVQLYLTLSASAVLSVLDHMRSVCRSCLLELWFQVEIYFFLLHAGLEMSGYLPRQSQPCILARTVVLCCAREGFCMLQISMCVALLWFFFAPRSGEERPKRVVKRCFGGIFEVSVVANEARTILDVIVNVLVNYDATFWRACITFECLYILVFRNQIQLEEMRMRQKCVASTVLHHGLWLCTNR